MDIPALVNSQIKHGEAQKMLLFDFFIAFGNIGRDILWTRLYGSGIPRKFAQILKVGH